jgi:hypothetical protein
VVWPAVKLRPSRGPAHRGLVHEGMSNGILGIIRAAGGRVRRTGTFPSTDPHYVVMNHQSLLDIPTAVLMAEPYIPRFIARARYGSWVPAVSLCMRLLGCPTIEPENRKASLRALQKAARDQPHGILVFPEGHRTRDGEIQEFHTAGLEIMLRERPLPVYVLVTDGLLEGAALRRLPLQHRPHRRADGGARSFRASRGRRIQAVPGGDPPGDGRTSAAAARRRGCGRLRRCGRRWLRACGRRCHARTRPRSPAPSSTRGARPCARSCSSAPQDQGAARRLQCLRHLRRSSPPTRRSIAPCASTGASATVRPWARLSTPGSRRTRSRCP